MNKLSSPLLIDSTTIHGAHTIYVGLRYREFLSCTLYHRHCKSDLGMRASTASKLLLLFSHSVKSNSLPPHGLQPARLLCPWDFSGKNTGVGCHFLLQGIFLTHGLNLCLISPTQAGGFFTPEPPGKPL